MLQLPESAGLPPVDSHIYVEWCEKDSDEPEGWYHYWVEQYQSDGSAALCYKDGASEILNLHSINWSFARKSGRCFLPSGTAPPHHPLKKVREAAQCPKLVKSELHSVKAYADDVTLFSTSKKAHQAALISLDEKCSYIGLQIRPDKRILYIFDGHKTCSCTTFKLQQGYIQNITNAPSKFLGQQIGTSPTSTI